MNNNKGIKQHTLSDDIISEIIIPFVFVVMSVIAFTILIVLKVTKIVTWSWWVICSPLLAIPAYYAVVGTIYTIALIVIAVVTLIELEKAIKKTKQNKGK